MRIDRKSKNKVIMIKETNAEFGTKIGLFAKLFGCWHRNISRPFSHSRQSYVVCLKCGARRHFNTNTLQVYGEFYFPPEVQKQNSVYN